MAIVESQCSQFTEEEFLKYSRNELLSGRTEDPLLLQTLSLNAKLSKESRVESLLKIFSSSDPLVLAELGLRLLIITDQGKAALYFDGVYYPLNTPSPLVAALYLVPCEFGMPCGHDDLMLALGCVEGGPCFASRLERARIEMSNGDESQFEQAIRLRDAIVGAIRRRDVAQFVQK
jgi:hypothetical protein